MASNRSFTGIESQPGRSQPQYNQRAVTEAAQHFMSLVARVIPEENARQGQTQSQIQQSVRPTVEHEMTRSFPGFFKNAGKNKRHLARKLELMQAGLGKRTLSLTSDTTHAELSSLLREAYSKNERFGRQMASFQSCRWEWKEKNICNTIGGRGVYRISDQKCF
ncbi:hypothetical protein F2P79_006614 [Pimephales promelas]|nr:hypothetical protein F2P79_006614 [Pimephales promelas]